MTKEKLLERIRKMKNGQSKTKPVKKVRHLSRQAFPETTRQKCIKFGRQAKKILMLSTISLLTLVPGGKDAIPATLENLREAQNHLEVMENKRQQTIDEIVARQTANLQKEILSNVSTLQQDITIAKRQGKRNAVVKKIFDNVYERGGLLGSMNYCVAGAMYAQRMCQDSVLSAILPDPAKTARDYDFSGHPNVSCPYMRQFFEQNLGDNYAERNDKNFKEFVKTLEAGDIITISSSQNTSTGEHCVTCAGPVVDGQIPVKSLNSERDYEVPVNRIVGAAKVMAQYRENLGKELNNELDIQSYMALAAEGSIVFTSQTQDFSRFADENSANGQHSPSKLKFEKDNARDMS